MGQHIRITDTLEAYRADPTGEVAGAIVVIHEIWGLVPNITDIADRFAAEGYIAVAPDLLSGIGVVPSVGLELQRLMTRADEAERTAAQPLLREKLAPSRVPEFADWAVRQLVAAVDYLADLPGVQGRIAVTGFCFGGGYAFALAAADSRIRAALPFYGFPPVVDAVSTITAPVLAFYGDLDTPLMTSLPDLTATLTGAGVDFEAQVYPGARHAFFNDTNAMTFNAEAAADAWQRSLAFLEARLPTR
jgi:carboxymethylenebutenolidase